MSFRTSLTVLSPISPHMLAFNNRISNGLCPDLAPLCPDLAPVSPDFAPLCPDLAQLCPDLAPVFPDLAPVCPDLAQVYDRSLKIINLKPTLNMGKETLKNQHSILNKYHVKVARKYYLCKYTFVIPL